MPKTLGTQWHLIHVCGEGMVRLAWEMKRCSAVGEGLWPMVNPTLSSGFLWIGPSRHPWASCPHTFGAVPGGRAVALGLALLRGWGAQGLSTLARRLACVAGAAHGALLLSEAALHRALWGTSDEPPPSRPVLASIPQGGHLPRPTPLPPSGQGDSGASCIAWWLAAWLRAGSARRAAWHGGLRSCKGLRGGGGLARSWGCTALEGVSCLVGGHPALPRRTGSREVLLVPGW